MSYLIFNIYNHDQNSFINFSLMVVCPRELVVMPVLWFNGTYFIVYYLLLRQIRMTIWMHIFVNILLAKLLLELYNFVLLVIYLFYYKPYDTYIYIHE